VSLTGANASDYVVTNNCTASVAPAGTCTIQVGFKPTVPGPKTATLSIASSASTTATTRTLTGTTLPTPGNLAQGKTATESSIGAGAVASRAVDGNADGVFANGSVSHTNLEPGPWWQVDLGAVSTISTINVFNRTDCCATRLNNAVVFVSTTDLSTRTFAQLQADATVTKFPLGTVTAAKTVIAANGVPGRFVKVQLPTNDFLHLAEVEVIGVAGTTGPSVTAVAATGSGTSATVTWTTNVASTSVVQYGTSAGSLTSTATGPSNVTAHSVTLTGLSPATQYFYRVTSADAAGNSVTSPVTTASAASFTLPGGANGNLALNKVVTASSSLEATPWSRSRAVDGVFTSTAASLGWSSSSSTGANHSEFFQVDLGTSQAVNQVSLYPRSDAGQIGQGFPVNFTIQTSADGVTFTTQATITNAPLPTIAQHFVFASTTARYVRISATSLRRNPGDGNQFRMQFAEVGIY
jgi:hypothetical protein